MKTLLIIDDEKPILMLYKVELEAEGYRVITSDNGNTALDTLRSAEIDLIILDIRMPGSTGLDLMEDIKHINRNIPIILNTAYSTYKDNFQSWLAEAYVVKSADLTELKDKVKEILEGDGK